MYPLEEKVRESLRQVYDPEVPVNIVDLGLIYDITEFPGNNIYIQMTVTTPNCPATSFLPMQVREKAEAVEGVNNVQVEIVYFPPWTIARMSESAKKTFGYY